jgi:hypothetical protein
MTPDEQSISRANVFGEMKMTEVIDYEAAKSRLKTVERELEDIKSDMNLLYYKQRALIGEFERLNREVNPSNYEM